MNALGTRTIRLPCFGITIRLDRKNTVKTHGAGTITSDLHRTDDLAADRRYNAAIDGLESLILAHACVGVATVTPAGI